MQHISRYYQPFFTSVLVYQLVFLAAMICVFGTVLLLFTISHRILKYIVCRGYYKRHKSYCHLNFKKLKKRLIFLSGAKFTIEFLLTGKKTRAYLTSELAYLKASYVQMFEQLLFLWYFSKARVPIPPSTTRSISGSSFKNMGGFLSPCYTYYILSFWW